MKSSSPLVWFEELADRDALDERRSVAVEAEQAFLDEPEDKRRDKDLRHAPDAEAVLGCQRLAGLDVGDAHRRFDPAARPGRHHDDTGNTDSTMASR